MVAMLTGRTCDSSRLLALATGGAFLVVALSACTPTPNTDGAPGAEDPVLAGAFDIHAHADPDSAGPHSIQGPRSLDVLELAGMAQARGMRGFIVKQHWDQTAQLAYLARNAAPGLEVFGGVVLNRTVGGINVAAVQHLAEVKGGWGRMVWMPTWDAEHYVRNSDQRGRPFVAVSRDGELLPEVKAVIAAMAGARTRDSNGALALATGHSSPEESLMLVREAREHGLQVVVTHPMLEFVGMSLAQMREAAAQGAFLEFVSAFAQGAQAERQIREYAAAIREIGPQFCIVSSDLGQVGRPAHPDGLVTAAAALRAEGFSDTDLQVMFRENPAKLLGLTVQP
jgi:hypothetical protein